MSDEEAVKVPRIETVEGIGADYLVWTKERILELIATNRALEERVARLEGTVGEIEWRG